MRTRRQDPSPLQRRKRKGGVHADIKALRDRLKQSRQIFATNLGISMSGLGYYERDRVPPVEVLLALAATARQAGFHDLGERFEGQFIFFVFEALRGKQVNMRCLNPLPGGGGGILIANFSEVASPLVHAVAEMILALSPDSNLKIREKAERYAETVTEGWRKIQCD